MKSKDQLSVGRRFFKRALAEPLLIFFVLSAGVFALDLFSQEDPKSKDKQRQAASLPALNLFDIEVDPTLINNLKERFSLFQGRQASAEEVEKLIKTWIRDEMIFRHAVSQDMHLGDSKIRARLLEKMNLLWSGAPVEPEQSEILAFYINNIEEYYSEPQISFSQVFFEELPQNYHSILQGLRAGEKIIGEGYWLGDEINNYTETIMLSTFGSEFYKALVLLPPNQWDGPLDSPRGYHFVLHQGLEDPAPLTFANIYERVRRNVLEEKQGKRIREQVAKIEAQFSIFRESDGRN
jgi:peptidyl-prolyl cis-trans isomerase C|tara:strand:+ start:2055 stop:2936 length:882 start_codon:yes stop_codon:yes gene_type:complete